ncbi:MAG TPA: tetratricopeptide repeat protein [Blastocatellia bacterium]|nr:tetratricopeptide repeat protein [Blastocatellia bacterium]
MKKSRLIVIASVVVLMLSVLGFAWATQTRKPTQRQTPSKKQATKKAPASDKVVTRQPDPNRAPQKAVDDALYTKQEFFGATVNLPRPYAEAATNVESLIAQFPKDSDLRLQAVRLDERTSQFDKSVAQMQEYVRLKNSSEDALRRQAAFYHRRALYTDEVRTLQTLAKASPVSQREPIYKRAIALVEEHKLTEFTPDQFYGEMIAGNPESFTVIKSYLQTLMNDKRYQKALEVINAYESKFNDQQQYFLKTHAEILEDQNNRAGAIAVYSQRFAPTWPRALASDYYELLRRYGKYRDYRRDLQAKIKSGSTDFDSVSRLFNVYAYESNIPYAAHVLAEYEQRKTGGGNIQGLSISAHELGTIADMYASIGYYDQASRYLYTLYLTGTLTQQSQAREDALYNLFKALIDAGDIPTRVGAGDLKFYQDVATVDQNPGLLNGVLSLILNGDDPAREFKAEEQKAAGYFNRAFAYRIFTSFKTEYATSKRLPQMYLDMIDAFAGFGENQLAVNLGKEFQTKYPKAPEYAAVGLKMADSLVALKQRVAERTTLQGVLDFLAANRPAGTLLLPVSSKRWQYVPSSDENTELLGDDYEKQSAEVFDPDEGEGNNGPTYTGTEYDYRGNEVPAAHKITYSEVLERMVASYSASQKDADALKFFWAEVKKHPKEEGLYERFLKWLEQTDLIDEQLKAYTAAINQYNSQTWYDRLARWYVKQKRAQAFVAYSRQLLDVFEDEEASAYMQNVGDSSIDGDRTIAFNVYRLAHDRFPHNIQFVKGLLTYYSNTNQPAEWEKLATQYYFADKDIRNSLIARYSRYNELRAKFDQAQKNRDKLSYRQFYADAAMWLSHFNDALDTYRQLARDYPGETAYVERLADLTRSLGHSDDKLYAESSKAWASLADIYPSVPDFRTKAGETLAEMGDFPGARAEWEKLLNKEQGNSKAYLDVASIFWDYYQWDDAIRTINELRRTSGDTTAYAYQMGALYEGKNEWEKAINEYVATLGDGDADQSKSVKRLEQLTPRKNYKEVIARAFEQRRSAQPDNSGLILTYAGYLQDTNRSEEAYTLLRNEVARRTDIAFLESARDVFHANQLTTDEQKVIARLIDSSRDVREQLQYRLQMAAFFEATGKPADAAQTFDKIVTDFPTNLGVIQEATSYYSRAGLIDKSIGLYKDAVGRAQGQYKRDFILGLADRQVSANKLADAEATLRGLYAQDPLDTDTFGRLVKVLGDENKNDALVELYKTGLENIKNADLDHDTATQRLRELRLGMVETLARLQRPSEAVDQYIEAINRQPEDSDLLNNAVAFSERNNQLDRLVKYYQDTSQKSFKDYRWNIVLARIAEYRGDNTTAAAQYKNAVLNEPQRLDFHSVLADSLIRTGQLDDAIAELHKAHDLDSGNPDWLTRIAMIQVQQGKRADAVATLRTAMKSSKNTLAATIFIYADKLKQWGLSKEALDFYNEGLTRYLKDPYQQSLDGKTLASFIEASLKNESPVATANRLESLNKTLQEQINKESNYEKYKIESAQRIVAESIEQVFAKDVAAYGNPEEIRPLADYYKRQIAGYNDYSDDSQKQLRHFATIGHNALLPDVEENSLIRLKDASYTVYKNGGNAGSNNATAQTTPAPATTTPRRGRQAATPAPVQPTSYTVEAQHYYMELRRLLSFYDSRASFDKGAQLLEAVYQQDPIKDKFNYFEEIAWRYEMLGQPDREMAALRQYYNSRAGDLTSNNDAAIERYLELLYNTSHVESKPISTNAASRTASDELRQIASKFNPYQLQVINFFIDHGEEALAQEAITHTNLSAAWVASRSAQVALYFKDQSSKAEGYFRVALDIKTIGDFIKNPKSATDGLSQHDWLWTARSYGMWLGLNDKRSNEVHRYITGLIERRPHDPGAQLQLASYYLGAKQTKRAADHATLAQEMAPNDTRVLAVKGSILFADGKQNDALALWNSIPARKGATIADIETYFKVMRDHKLARQALPQIENFLVSHVNKADAFEVLKPFIREVAYSAYADDSEKIYQVAQAIGSPQQVSTNYDTQLGSAITTMFRNVTNRLQDNLLLPEMVLNEQLVSDADRADFYRTVISRQANKVLALIASGENADKYSEWNGNEYVSPLDSMNKWREQYVNYLTDHKSYAQARTELQQYRALDAARQKDNYKNSSSSDNSDTSDDQSAKQDWMVLAEARLNIREGKSAEALKSLRNYAAVGVASTQSGIAYIPDKDRAVAAYLMLRNEGKFTEADQLMRDVYSQLIAARQLDSANYAGLAELEFKVGSTDRALTLLKQMVDAHIGDENTLELAATIAARYQSFNAALDWRHKAQTLNVEDSENQLETARVLAAMNRRTEAADVLATIIDNHSSPNTARAAAAFLMPEAVKGDSAALTHVMDVYRQKASSGNLYARLVLAELLDASGQTSEAENMLKTGASQPYSGIANLVLGSFELKHGNAGAAMPAFEADLYQDPDALVSQTVTFAAGLPREQLIKLYSTSGRQAAALVLANQSSDYRRASGRGDDEGGLVYSAGSEGSILDSQSSAWFLEIYLYPLYSRPSSSLFRIPPGHGPLGTDQSATQIDDSSSAKFHTIAELNLEAALQGRRSTLRLLSDMSARDGNFAAAIDFERARRPLLVTSQSITESNNYLITLIGKQHESEKRLIARAHIDQKLTDEPAEAQPPEQ